MPSINLGKPGDFHVHLREKEMMELVTPEIRRGGASVCFVMPNLVPPLKSVEKVLEYKKQLQKLAPTTTFLMSLYLGPEITPKVICEAKKAGITGVKCYPAGVTTNSEAGISSYEMFYPTFAEMEKQDLVLNLHGECPSGDDITVLNAEEKFLPTLYELHDRFPNLRIVLEHCTSRAAVEAVQRCGPLVAATITAHHLYLTVDSWGGNALNFCKPVAKFPDDKKALIEAAVSGSPKFFFGSDSAPHPIEAKSRCCGASAGVYTQSHGISYVAEVFEAAGKLDALKGFVSDFGKQFYKVNDSDLAPGTLSIEKASFEVEKVLKHGSVELAPFKGGETLNWRLHWSE